jgi:hypothetical protein
MGAYITIGKNRDWGEAMDWVCSCGHTLGNHAFTMKMTPEGDTLLYTSQCVICKDDEKTGKPGCEGFQRGH